jgi:peptidoglycan/LPS O-acetylase OafA/YrhL
MAHLRYLAPLDGLRGIAVLVVVIFHSKASWLTGGFVGVDVFFFLSGFLITQIVVSSLESGRFSYVDFIAGRVRRLFPAYVAMLCGTLIAAPLILLPAEFERLAETALASLVFASNIFFYDNLGYFDAAADQQLLLHTWSLAVEWQFYLVFPLILWAAHRFTGRVLPVLLLVAAVSLVGNLVITPEDSGFTFFMFPTRAWELIVGGLLGLAYMNGKLGGRERGIYSVLGLVLLGAAVFVFDKDTLFPGVAVLLPILATALLVFNTIRGDGGWLTTLLSSKVLVLTGQMSYSLYLWHWPILLYARFYFGDHLTLPQLLLCWSMTIGLSYISWRWIESIFRRHRYLSGRWRAYIGALAISVPLSAVAGIVMLNDGYEGRLSNSALSLLNVEKWPDFGQCSTDYSRDQYYDCVIGADYSPASVLVWGDSHAQTLIWAVNDIVERRKIAVRHVTKGGCPPTYYGVPVSANIDKEACLKAQQAAWTIIESDPAISTVFISARWSLYEAVSLTLMEDEALTNFDKNLTKTIQTLLNKGKNVVLVDSLPEPGFDVANLLAREMLLKQEPTQVFEEKRQACQHLKPIVGLQNNGLKILHLSTVLCADGSCPLRIGENLLYFDGNHLAKAGATKLAENIERSILYEAVDAD